MTCMWQKHIQLGGPLRYICVHMHEQNKKNHKNEKQKQGKRYPFCSRTSDACFVFWGMKMLIFKKKRGFFVLFFVFCFFFNLTSLGEGLNLM